MDKTLLHILYCAVLLACACGSGSAPDAGVEDAGPCSGKNLLDKCEYTADVSPACQSVQKRGTCYYLVPNATALECRECVDTFYDLAGHAHYSECTCTEIGASCAGDSGVCTYLGTGAGQFGCQDPGSKAAGEPCAKMNDCQVGSQCLDQDRKCYAVCDTCHPCASGACINTGLGFSVCR